MNEGILRILEVKFHLPSFRSIRTGNRVADSTNEQFSLEASDARILQAGKGGEEGERFPHFRVLPEKMNFGKFVVSFFHPFCNGRVPEVVEGSGDIVYVALAHALEE